MMQIFDDAGNIISTHAPAGGATRNAGLIRDGDLFLLTPLREGRQRARGRLSEYLHFYSRPCGRGDVAVTVAPADTVTFLLTPLREGRPAAKTSRKRQSLFLLTPLREGRPAGTILFTVLAYFYSRPCGRGDERICYAGRENIYFYSRPCGRGDAPVQCRSAYTDHFYSRPCGRGDGCPAFPAFYFKISTHAPAGGATSPFR